MRYFKIWISFMGLILLMSGLGFSASYVSIYEELKTEHPVIVENLMSKGATEDDIKMFLDELSAKISSSGELTEANFDDLMFHAMKEVLFVNGDIRMARDKYQELDLALGTKYGSVLSDGVLSGELQALRNIVKNKLIPTTPTTPGGSIGGGSIGGGSSVGGGGAVTGTVVPPVTDTPADTIVFTKNENSKAIQFNAKYLEKALETLNGKSLSLKLEDLDLSAGEEIAVDSLMSIAGKNIKVSMTMNDVSLSLKSTNLSELKNNGLKVQYKDQKLTLGFGENKMDLSMPIVATLPVPAELKSSLTVVRYNADGTSTPVGGAFKNGQATFLTDKPGIYGIESNPVSFSDFQLDDYWATDKVETLATLGIISGKGEDHFDPNASITRAEFATLVTKMLQYDGVSSTSKFTDVEGSVWYAPYVAIANAYGLMDGKSQDSFDPNGPITQQEILTVLSKVLKAADVEKGTEESESSYTLKTDTAATWAKPLIENAISNGALRGMPLENVDMSKQATRLETANMLYELLPLIYQ
ncbi:S-layer homology domain-containing protein [Fusibacter ferrireducens]|uniref:S-layer homology domain-containing protein n=1 Tax=Fusibacter ferrireducens TaxID=2785058 RepID=A0ABR9ZXC8_9FIRM|nr:S-layer homology domain-containing protein [Fusibacter ferrireducens]MBF4695123.1 S-layer homology domain-containing protein [Fusibacter ferrireducens]